MRRGRWVYSQRRCRRLRGALAWRTLAVTVGGLLALGDEAVRQLRARHTDPHQAARIGQMPIHCQTAANWIDAVPTRHQGEPKHFVVDINLARFAIERACLEVIPLVQRGLGTRFGDRAIVRRAYEQRCRHGDRTALDPYPSDARGGGEEHLARGWLEQRLIGPRDFRSGGRG
jgi:hypothetical protein